MLSENDYKITMVHRGHTYSCASGSFWRISEVIQGFHMLMTASAT